MTVGSSNPLSDMAGAALERQLLFPRTESQCQFAQGAWTVGGGVIKEGEYCWRLRREAWHERPDSVMPLRLIRLPGQRSAVKADEAWSV
jgi:hypothetical protein